MKKIVLEVCMCTECVMMGGMDIIESVETLQTLKTQLRLNSSIQIVPQNCIGAPNHGKLSPVVSLNGEILTKVSGDAVMSSIISMSKGVK